MIFINQWLSGLVERRRKRNLWRRTVARLVIDEWWSNRWDYEWLHYFLEKDPSIYFVSEQQLKGTGEMRDKMPEEVYHTHLFSSDRTGDLPPIRLWIHGNELLGKRVLEIGCGAGFTGKQLGKHVDRYIGIDHSKFALSIARLTSPKNCFYYHMSELEKLAELVETVDLMVCRDFFIHQNYSTAHNTLRLAFALLKPGGFLTADFFLENLEIGKPVTYNASQDLDHSLPSCSFVFSIEEVQRLALESGFLVINITDKLDLRRRFVRYRKPGGDENGRNETGLRSRLPMENRA